MLISLHVIPKASKNEIVGWVDDPPSQNRSGAAGAKGGKALKVKVTAAPDDGKANAAIIKFLAKTWGVPASSLEIVSGHTNRHKRLKIHGNIPALPPQ